MKTRFSTATALSPQEAFRAKIVTPKRFLHELSDFMSLMFGESLSGYIRKDDSSFCRKLNQPREIRYKRLVSVLRAYNLFPETVRHPQVLRFVSGDFFNAGQITEDEARDRIGQVCRMGEYGREAVRFTKPRSVTAGSRIVPAFVRIPFRAVLIRDVGRRLFVRWRRAVDGIRIFGRTV